MGKKGSKRRTRWKALPLAGEDGGSGNEDEVQDDVQSTTSSGRIVLRMGERPFRSNRRYPYDRDRSREPLVKLESKTFDEEEYTKITTPRQDVLFKKGYFARRKNESSNEENNSNINEETEGEEGPMEQLIITNGFLDERGHYLVNGSSYEVYDPYSNTVTVVVGPPPYHTGVPPVLAAVSCQPVPLQPVDWYNPGPGDWPVGPAWTPAYPPPPKAPESGSSEGGSSTCSEETIFAPPPHPFLYPPGIPLYPIPFTPNGVADGEEGSETGSGTDTSSMCQETTTPATPPPEKVPIQEEKFENNCQGKEKTPSSESHVENNPPKTQLNPAGPEFVPRCPPRPNGFEFVPTLPLKPIFIPHLPVAPLKPTGPGYLPHQTINPTPQHRLSPHELQPRGMTTISKPQETLEMEKPKTPEKENNSVVPEEAPIETLQKETVQINESKPRQDSEPQAQKDSPVIVDNVQTVERLPRKSHSTQTSPEVDAEKLPEYRKLPGNSASPRHSAKRASNTSVNNKKAAVIENNGQFNSRRSYAKTVMNGLDHISSETMLNDRIITNGLNNRRPSVEKEVNGKEYTKQQPRKNAQEKEPVLNGPSARNEKRDQITNGSVASPVKERLTNGKEAFVNGKITRHNKDHSINGNGRIPKYEKRPEKSEKLTNGNSEKNYDSTDSDNFIPVENKRNSRSLHNGYSKIEGKNKSYNKEQVIDVQQIHHKDGNGYVRRDKPKQSYHNYRENTISNKTVSSTKMSTLNVESVEKEVEKTVAVDDKKEIIVPEKPSIDSDKSSTISELSSPTELSSGQTTPPTKSADMEEKRANDLSKSMEKLKENLEGESEERKIRRNRKSKKKVAKVEAKEKAEEAPKEEDEVPLPAFLQPPQDELSHLDALLGGAATNAILRSLRVNEPSITKVNLFAPRPTAFPCDLFTKTNLSNMRATRPEEFFASIVENPIPTEPLKFSEKPKKLDKLNKAPDRLEPVRDSQVVLRKPISTAYKPSKKKDVKKEDEFSKNIEEKTCDQRLGIVDAVKTWLESQDDPEQVLGSEVGESESSSDSKNEMSNPLHALSPECGHQNDSECNRVAENGAETIDVDVKKLIANSASIRKELEDCQEKENAAELAALVDARLNVDKYYSLSPLEDSTRQSVSSETSEQDAIDALEYPFPRPASADVSISDPTAFPTKELACKLQ